jgi:hypothetical protein
MRPKESVAVVDANFFNPTLSPMDHGAAIAAPEPSPEASSPQPRRPATMKAGL